MGAGAVPEYDFTENKLGALLARVDAESDRITALVREAFEAGRDAERASTASTLRTLQEQIGRLLGTPPAPSHSTEEEPVPPEGERGLPPAKRGSVRPRVLEILREMPLGPTVKEAFAYNSENGRFHIAEPSIRSTLGDLRAQGFVEKRGERWFLLEKEKGAESEPSSKSDQEPQSRDLGSSTSDPDGAGPFHRVRSNLLGGTASVASFNPKHPSLRG